MDRTSQFLKLFLAHEMELRAFIGALVRERAAREDVFRGTALALWQSYDSYDLARSFGAWARGVITGKMLQQRRRDARLPIAFSPETIEAVRDAFDRTEAAPGEREGSLVECLKRLPARSAEMLTLRYGQGSSASAIATQLHISVDVVHQTLGRLRAQLGECVRRQLISNQVLRG